MQRSQRDTARRNDYASFAANITGYITNNNGRLPSDSSWSYVDSSGVSQISSHGLDPKKYINESGTDTAGHTYYIAVIKCDKSTAGQQCTNGLTGALTNGVMTEMTQNSDPRVVIVKGAACGDEQGTVKASSGNRDYALLGQLESGVYCQDNV
ncbi:hypothetical protein IKE86_01435 [Candidatus Saccharibacteria bacterium]|nr:hypothetical protein [Candidatus Saccharibacteria bacterium]